MEKAKRTIKSCLRISRLTLMSPILVLFFMSSEKITILADVKRWADILKPYSAADVTKLLNIFTDKIEFRNLYYYRIHQGSDAAKILLPFIQFFYRGSSTLYISCADIGAGLFIQHGFSTIVAARKIGDNCWINQQVTIGYVGNEDAPILGNNVRVSAGAIVLGNVHLGDNVIVGANAVVVKDVPANCVVVGVPAYIVKRNGQRVNEPLK